MTFAAYRQYSTISTIKLGNLSGTRIGTTAIPECDCIFFNTQENVYVKFHVKKLGAYSLQNTAISPNICWLFVILLATDIFSSLSLLSELVDYVDILLKFIEDDLLMNRLLLSDPVTRAWEKP